MDPRFAMPSWILSLRFFVEPTERHDKSSMPTREALDWGIRSIVSNGFIIFTPSWDRAHWHMLRFFENHQIHFRGKKKNRPVQDEVKPKGSIIKDGREWFTVRTNEMSLNSTWPVPTNWKRNSEQDSWECFLKVVMRIDKSWAKKGWCLDHVVINGWCGGLLQVKRYDRVKPIKKLGITSMVCKILMAQRKCNTMNTLMS